MIRIPKIRMKWKWLLIIIPFLLLLPTVFVLSLEHYTTSNYRFCLTCHYKMWGKDFLVTSKVHPASVTCPECHAKEHSIFIPPKNFSAHPDRINPNCIRCHKNMLERNDTNGFKFNVMHIKIPHKFHLTEAAAVCTDCHYNIKHDKELPQTNRPRMQACFACHDQKTTSCLKCHTKGSKMLISLLPKGKEISKSLCEKCHEGFEQKEIDIYGLKFYHTKHLSMGIACNTCHNNEMQHGSITKDRAACLNCHHTQKKVGCVSCHPTQNAMRQGTAFKEVKGPADKMYGIVDCNICHAGIAKGHSLSDVKKACSQCHEPNFPKKVNEIQSRITKELKDVTSRLQQVKAMVTGNKEAEAEVDNAEKAIAAINADKSKGFHNSQYARRLIEYSIEQLKKAGGRSSKKR